MKRRTSFGIAIPLTLLVVASALAQQKDATNEDANEVLHRRQAQLQIAQRDYRNLTAARAQAPGKISDEAISRVSLLILRFESAIATTREDGIKAASAYLDREGLSVPK